MHIVGLGINIVSFRHYLQTAFQYISTLNLAITSILLFRQFLILPKQADPTAPRVMLMRMAEIDPAKYSPLETMSIMSVISKVINPIAE